MHRVDTGLDKDAGRKSPEAATLPAKGGGFDALFEQLAYYALLLALGIGAAFVVLRAADELSISLSATGKIAAVIFAILATLIALNWHFDSSQGQQSQTKLRQTAKRWAYPITLIVGLALGWQWREHGDPDHDRKQAEQIAASACGQISGCLALAQRAAGGADIAQYLKPKPGVGTR